MKKIKITISGWYGHENAGDEAILQVSIKELLKIGNIELTILTSRPDRVLEMYGAKGINVAMHVPLFSITSYISRDRVATIRLISILRQTDVFLLGGGGLLRDNTNWRNLFKLLDEIWLTKLFGGKTALFALGVGPFQTRFGKWIISRTARLCDLITVRDSISGKLLESIGIRRSRIVITGDPAFLLDESKAKPKFSRRNRTVMNGRYIAVLPALGIIDDGTNLSEVTKIAKNLDSLYEKCGLKFIAVPMRVLKSGWDDVRLSDYIKNAMKNRDAMDVLQNPLTIQEIVALIAAADMAITIRLHAAIFSVVSNTRFLAINYEPKVKNVLDDLGLANYVVSPDDDEYLIWDRKAVEVLNGGSEHEIELEKARDRAIINAKRTFDEIAKMIKV